MRKTFNLLLAGLLTFGIVACEKPQPEEDNEEEEKLDLPPENIEELG